MNYTIMVLAAYAVIMIAATVLMTNKEKSVERGTHLLEPMKAIVKELMGEGKSVEEIGKQLGMRPEEIFRLSDFSKEDFLNMMIKPNQGYSKAEFITKI